MTSQFSFWCMMTEHNNNCRENTVGFSRLNHFFATTAVWSFRHRWIVMLLCMAVLGLAIYLAQTVRMDNSFEAFFDETDPNYSAYNTYRENFGSDELIYIMYDASKHEHGVFNKAIIEKIQQLGDAIGEKVPFVSKVRNITNAELMIGLEDELVIRKIEEELPLSQAQLLEFADIFSKKPLYVGNLFDKTHNLGAISVEMSRSSTDPLEKIRLDQEGGDALDNLYPQVSQYALEKVLADPQFADLDYYLSGDVPLNTAYNLIIDKETAQLSGLSFLIIAVVLGVFFRGRIIGIIGPLTVVALSIMMTIAFIAAMGWNVDMMFGLAPTLLVAIGVAHAVHIISEFLINFRESGDRESAIHKTLYLVGTPCLLTSLTTAAGFAAMSVAPIKTISHMAVYVSIGVLCAFFLSVTLLTFFLSFTRTPKKDTSNSSQLTRLDKVLRVCSEIAIRRSYLTLSLFLMLMIVSGIGLFKVRIDSNILTDFSESVTVRQHTEHIDQTMGGMSSFAYLFDSGKEGGIKEPAFLHELDRVQRETETHQPLVRKTMSIVDLIKDINQTFHADDPAYYKIPDSRELISQYMLVYELSGGEDLFSYITHDYSQALLEMRVQLTASSVLADFEAEMTTYLDQKPLIESEKSITGIGSLWLTLINYISDSQVRGLTLALIVITILISLIFGSLKMGLVSMIPNVAPIFVVGGVMGWLGVNLDSSKLLIATIAIGIAVDDTIHMMTRFKMEFELLGNYREAFRKTLHEVGRALVITSATLVLGWSALLTSVMDAQVWFGILLSSTVVLALLADFFIMPVLVFWLKPFGPEIGRDQSAAI